MTVAKRVGFLVQATSGFGGERVFNTIVRETARAGQVDPLVITIDESWSSTAAAMEVEQTTLSRSGRGPLGLLRAAEKLHAVIRDNDLAATVSFMTYANLVNLLGARFSRPTCRVVLSEHTQTGRSLSHAPWPRAMRAAVKALYPSADAILAVSQAVRTELVQDLGLPAGLVRVVDNPVDVEAVLRGADAAAARRPLLGRSGRRLVTIGALNSAKGHSYALEALATMPMDYHLDVVGDGPLRGKLEQQAFDLGLAGRVRFHGFLGDPYPLLATADVLVHPSVREAFGLAVVEAGVLGVPVVATAVGGLQELVPEPVPGVLVRPADAAELAAGIESMLRRPAGPDGEVTRRKVRDRFDPVSVSLRYQEAALGAATEGVPE
jgi:glycosyltransferase involved in cell wall biosynthesis